MSRGGGAARWSTAPAVLRVTLWMLLTDLPPASSLLLLATADVPLEELDSDVSPPNPLLKRRQPLPAQLGGAAGPP